jgi:hypothetical protein
MSLSEQRFQQLSELLTGERHQREEAVELAGSTSGGDLAAWLQKRVGNPAAERYLLDLYFGQDGAKSGDAKAYRRFYRELELRLRPQLQRTVLGWGEISQVAEVVGSCIATWRHPDSGDPMPVVYKKMPAFLNRADAETFVQRYLEYNTVLRDEVGIAVPHFDARITQREPDRVYIFVIQERVDPASVGHELLREVSIEAGERLYALILREYVKFFNFNEARSGDGYQVGLDGQIPNWSVVGYGGDPEALTGEEQLLYLDTNIPMIRIDNKDVVSTDMYFQALPGAARWIIKRLNLDQEVMDRYFQVRASMLDFLGNTIVRHREDLVPRFLEMSNEMLAGPMARANLSPFTMEEVKKYYRSDVATWRLWRSLKLMGTLSDGISGGDWRVLGRVNEFYRIWTEPIF